MNDEMNNGAVEATAEATPPVEQSTETPPQEDKADKGAETLLDSAASEAGSNAENEVADKPEDQAEKPAEGAPEKYEDFKLPEGTAFDSAVAQKFSEVAKELNLSQEKAQSVVDKMLPIMHQRQLEQIKAISDGWRQKSESTPEIVDHIADVARLRDRFAFNEDGTMDPDIQEFMASPAGNHPGCLKLLARAGRAFGESGFPKGQPAPRKLTASDVYR